MFKELNEFEKYLLVKKGISYITLKGYSGTIRRLVKDLGTLTPSHNQITDYIVMMYDKQYSYHYIVNTSLAIEWYMRFINNPIILGRPKKPQHIIKDTLTEAEIAVLINFSKNIREKAIISLLAYSGIRNKELCNLRVSDINLGENTARILDGKGKKDRFVNISGSCSKIIMSYLDEYPRSQDDNLFTTLRLNNRYGENDLRKLTHVLAKRCGIKKRVYPHIFRHIGHAFIETTMTYLRSFPQRIRNEYNLYAPSYV